MNELIIVDECDLNYYPIKIIEIKCVCEPRHRGLGGECTTSVHSFGRVEGSNLSLSNSFSFQSSRQEET